MRSKYVLLVVLPVVLVLGGCNDYLGRSADQSDVLAKQKLSEAEEKVADLERSLTTQPSTDPLLLNALRDLKQSTTDLRAAIALQKTDLPPVVGAVSTGASGVLTASVPAAAAIIPVLAAAIATVWGATQTKKKQDAEEATTAETDKRLRQVQELTTTVELAGGLKTSEQKLAAMKVQSEDTIQDVRLAKPQALNTVEAVKAV